MLVIARESSRMSSRHGRLNEAALVSQRPVSREQVDREEDERNLFSLSRESVES